MVGTIGAYHNRSCSVLPMLPRTVRPQFGLHHENYVRSWRRITCQYASAESTDNRSNNNSRTIRTYLKLCYLLWRRMGVAWIPVAQNGSQTATHTYATDNRNYMGTMARTRNSHGPQLWHRLLGLPRCRYRCDVHILYRIGNNILLPLHKNTKLHTWRYSPWCHQQFCRSRIVLCSY